MAATAWAFYHTTKKKLGEGGYNLSTDLFNLALFKTAATNPADNPALSIKSQISNECSGGAYTAGGKTLSANTWTATATSTYKFDSADWVITATGTAISAVLFAGIYKSASAGGGPLLCYSQLSTAAFDVTTGNTLTIQMNAAGIFTLAG